MKAEHKANHVVVEERTRTVTILQQEVDQLTRQLQEAEHHAHSDSTALDRTTSDLTRVRRPEVTACTASDHDHLPHLPMSLHTCIANLHRF